MDCIFCKIAHHEITSKIIYEDNMVIAFLDINPNKPGHTLIIPKKHIKDIDDIDEKTYLHIFNIAKKIKNILINKLNCDGIQLCQNNGVCQDVKHYHLHIIPRYPHDDIKYLSNEKQLINVEDVFEQMK